MKQMFALSVAAACLIGLSGPAFAMGSPRDPGSMGDLPMADRLFLDAAAQSNMEEIALGNLAREKGGSEAVKEHGEMMVADHTKAAMKEMWLAKKLGSQLPMMMGDEQRANVDRLQNLQGSAFDMDYLRTMVAAHEKALNLFREEARNGMDPDVRHFAAMNLPVLQAHYEHSVKQLRQQRRPQR